MTELERSIEELDKVWASQGRDLEHIHAVHNFLTGAGKTAILSLIQGETDKAKVEEIELAKSNNMPAGGMHAPSLYVIDPDYATDRLNQLKKGDK